MGTGKAAAGRANDEAAWRETQAARERAADERQGRADERERQANERERVANEREAWADERERVANERDHGTLYNTQLIFDADGALVLSRRKLTPTFHERMIWGQGT